MDKSQIGTTRIEDLIVLQYASNTCYTTVSDAKDFKDELGTKVRINLSKQTWSYLNWKNVKIGKSRSPYDGPGNKVKEGVIGVYNRLNTEHLDSLVYAAYEFTASEYYGDD